MIRTLFIVIGLFFLSNIYCQNNTLECNLEHLDSTKAIKVDKSDILCIAQTSEKKYTIIYTFAIWCSSCIKHLEYAIELEKAFNVQVYILLIDPEKSKPAYSAINFINKKYPDSKILILKDSVYGSQMRKKNKSFLTEITPPTFENTLDLSKYIVIDQSGSVLMITNYKDRDSLNGENRNDDTGLINYKIIPIIKR